MLRGWSCLIFGFETLLKLKKSRCAGLALSAASTYSPRNIRVNLVVPGLVSASPLLSQLWQNKYLVSQGVQPVASAAKHQHNLMQA